MFFGALIMGVIVGNSSVFAMESNVPALAAGAGGQLATVLPVSDSVQQQADRLNQFLQVQMLQTQLDMYKNMQGELAKVNAPKKKKSLKEQCLDALKKGSLEGVELLGSTAVEGVRLVFKGGVVIVITGFSAAVLWQFLVSSGYNPAKLAGTVLWKLLSLGWHWGSSLFVWGPMA